MKARRVNGPSRCVGCARRQTCKVKDVIFDGEIGEPATWQCVYCGTVQSREYGPLGRWINNGVMPITLAPGELEEMRDARAREAGRG